MNLYSKLSAALAAFLIAGAAGATPVVNNWVFNPAGQGFEGGQIVNEYIDANGAMFHQVARTGEGTFSFRQHGVFNMVHADSNGILFPINYPGGNITAIYEAHGAGELGGAIRFDGGSVSLYQNPVANQFATREGFYGANLGRRIAQLQLTPHQGGLMDATGMPAMQQQIIMLATPLHLEEGYFYRGSGRDLSGAKDVSFALTFAYTPGWFEYGYAVSEVACEYAGFTGPGCDGSVYRDVPHEHVMLSINGQLKLAEVPEPGTVALFGIGVMGAAALRRRRAARGQAASA